MKFIRLFLSIILIFSIAFTIFFGARKITEKKPYDIPSEYKGVITMWQVDTFEGGTGSRKQFLLKASRSFEKENEGILVMVTNYTVDGVKDKFKNGIFPDLISYGNGVSVTNTCPIKVANSVSGGLIGEHTYATAWCRGGYVLIANAKKVLNIEDCIDEIIVSQSEYTQPLTALSLEGITVKKYSIKKPMDAYVDFVSGKTDYLLGTQRDVIRLERRGVEVVTRPLCKYNDLYQYVSLTGADVTKNVYAERFINHLLSEDVQKDLNSIGMLSCFYKVGYDNAHMSKLQESVNEYTISAFISPEKLKEMQRLSNDVVFGNKESLIKIKNMLV